MSSNFRESDLILVEKQPLKQLQLNIQVWFQLLWITRRWQVLIKELDADWRSPLINEWVQQQVLFPPQEVVRKDWMFKLVGKETFTVGSSDTKATIVIEAISGFAYEYTLQIAGKSLQKFIDNRAQTTKTWLLKVDGQDYRVVLGESPLMLAVWLCNGSREHLKHRSLICSGWGQSVILGSNDSQHQPGWITDTKPELILYISRCRNRFSSWE